MLMKFLPGLIIASALGIFFSISPVRDERAAATRQSAVRRSTAARVDAQPSVPARQFGNGVAIPRNDGQNGDATNRSDGHFAGDDSFVVSRLDLQAMAPAARARDHSETRKTDERGWALASLSFEGPERNILSNSAFAAPSLVNHTDVVLPEPPAMGIRVWSDARLFRENQKPRNSGSSVYRHDGKIYTIGLKRDWSMDSVVGLSANMLDGTVKSRHPGDGRKDEIRGYMINAHYDGLIAGKLPFDLSAGYGRVDNRTRGNLRFAGHPGVFAWHEDKHRSDLYGASGGIGIPVIVKNVKMLGEFRFDYRTVKSRAYDFRFDGTAYGAPKTKSSSLTIPVMLTFSDSMTRRWGMLTARASLGRIFELDDDGLPARTYNSSAAYGVAYDPVMRILADSFYDKSQGSYFHFGAGVDLKTVGGWELRADYTYRIAERYKSGEFKLELARCF